MGKWRYFGRTDVYGKAFEIYRIPANGNPFHEQERSDVERLRRDGSWAYDPADVDGIWREVFFGDFDEKQDELAEEEVKKLFQEWSMNGWPGRI